MKVLVTGGSGFVGPHVVKALVRNGHSVVTTGHGPTQTDADVHYLELDLMRPQDIERLPLQNIDAVVHLAGLAAVGPSFAQPLNYITTNAAMQLNLCERIIALGSPCRFLTISSGSLYASLTSLPYDERTTVVPSSPYAISKLTREAIAQYYELRGLTCLIARPFNHIGPGQRAGFIVPDLARQVVAVERGEQTTISAGNLDVKRDYTDVRDICRAYVALLERGRSGEIYNVCSGTSLSGSELLNHLLQLSGLQHLTPIIDPAKQRPVDAPEIIGSAAKLTSDTGWTPTIPIDQTLSDVLTEHRAN